MSLYQNDLLRRENGGRLPEDRTQKMLLTLKDKKRYYRNLQLYLHLGLKLKKIHKVLSFDQKAWMAPYIGLNTELRERATSDFEKNFFKLMNNSVFGKTTENLRHRIDVRLTHPHIELKKTRKLTSSPRFARSTAFGDTLVGVQMHKEKTVPNRPVQICAYIL